MNIIEAKELYSDEGHLKKFDILCDFYRKIGNHVTAGYLGSIISNIRFDDMGNLEFQSFHQVADLETLSTGALLNDGIIIRQIQKNSQGEDFQLFSWNKDYSKYTYVLFDDLMAMDISYDIIKASDSNLCTEDVTDTIRSLRLPIDNILQVKENVEVDAIEELNIEDASSYSARQDLDSDLGTKVI